MNTSKALILSGIGLFVLPVVLGIYHMWIESWHLLDWVILYSFVYWPIYLLGIALIAGGFAIHRKKSIYKK